MLNVPAIKAAMRSLGLSGKALADACEVSKEAVSNWLSGEAVPRPRKLAILAEKLNLTVDDLLVGEETPEPVIAYRTRLNRAPTGPAKEAGDEVGRHLRQLLPYTGTKALFSPRHLENPVFDEAYICEAAEATRASLEVGPSNALTSAQLLELLHNFGAIVVPVFWGGDRDGHENAMSVYLPESKASWVLFNLGCQVDDFNYWLAHEFGHCLTLHALRDKAGEDFAELFAQRLLFPEPVAEEALAAIRASGSPLTAANWFAGKYNVSIVTVVKEADRVAKKRGERSTGLLTDRFWGRWRKARKSATTVAKVVFGVDAPSPSEYVIKSEEVFRTPVFRALAKRQHEDGGRNPAFIAAALNLDLKQANDLSQALWGLSS
jgi:transcriptional regulator with XRE-family HTH domain